VKNGGWAVFAAPVGSIDWVGMRVGEKVVAEEEVEEEVEQIVSRAGHVRNKVSAAGIHAARLLFRSIHDFPVAGEGGWWVGGRGPTPPHTPSTSSADSSRAQREKHARRNRGNGPEPLASAVEANKTRPQSCSFLLLSRLLLFRSSTAYVLDSTMECARRCYRPSRAPLSSSRMPF
jgi:hypothetical protein